MDHPVCLGADIRKIFSLTFFIKISHFGGDSQLTAVKVIYHRDVQAFVFYKKRNSLKVENNLQFRTIFGINLFIYCVWYIGKFTLATYAIAKA